MAVLTVVDMMIPPITLDPGWAGTEGDTLSTKRGLSATERSTGLLGVVRRCWQPCDASRQTSMMPSSATQARNTSRFAGGVGYENGRRVPIVGGG